MYINEIYYLVRPIIGLIIAGSASYCIVGLQSIPETFSICGGRSVKVLEIYKGGVEYKCLGTTDLTEATTTARGGEGVK